MELDPVLLSRLQFTFTISFHIIFPSFTIGLAGRQSRRGRSLSLATIIAALPALPPARSPA
jgi:hypothetical protein